MKEEDDLDFAGNKAKIQENKKGREMGQHTKHINTDKKETTYKNRYKEIKL